MSTAPDSAQRVPGYSWFALAILFLVYLFNFVDRQILSILANDIKRDLGIGDAQLGFLYGTAFAVFYALFGVPLGRLADSWSRTRLLSLGLALWSGMTTLSGLSRNLATLTVARIGVGVGEATANPCAYSLIADWFPQRMRGTAIALYSSGLFVGSGLSLLIGGAIDESWNAAYPAGGPLGLVGWQAAFILVGLPGVALAVLTLFLREPVRGAMDGLAGQDNPRPWRDFADQLAQIVPPFTLIGAARRGAGALAVNLLAAGILALLAWVAAQEFDNGDQFAFVAIGFYATFSWAAHLRASDRETFAMTWGGRAFMGVVLAYGTVSYVGYSIVYWAAPYAERSFAFSKTELGLLVGAPNALGGFIGVIFGGWLADRLARRFAAGRAMVTALALALVAPLVAIGYASASPAIFLVCNFLAQAVTSSALGASVAASQALVLPRMRGTAAAIFLLGPTMLGLAFGPFAVGYVSQQSGSLAIGVIASLVAVVPGLLALTIAITAYPAALRAVTRSGRV